MKTRKSKFPGRHISQIAVRYHRDRPSRFYKTGIEALDEYTGGLPSGEMTLIAARPGVGKTALVMQIMEYIGEHHKEPSGIFSVEMSGRSLVTRMILARTTLPSIALRKGELTQRQLKERDRALEEIGKLPIYIDDSSINTIPHIENAVAAWVKHGIKVLGLDYVQLLSPGGGDASDTRASFIGSCARTMKRLAKDMDVPFIVLAQLNRESSKGRRPPTIADLKESGDLEQVADNIILLNPDQDNPPAVDFLLAKWRNGPTGIISCDFDGARGHFASLSNEE